MSSSAIRRKVSEGITGPTGPVGPVGPTGETGTGVGLTGETGASASYIEFVSYDETGNPIVTLTDGRSFTIYGLTGPTGNGLPITGLTFTDKYNLLKSSIGGTLTLYGISFIGSLSHTVQDGTILVNVEDQIKDLTVTGGSNAQRVAFAKTPAQIASSRIESSGDVFSFSGLTGITHVSTFLDSSFVVATIPPIPQESLPDFIDNFSDISDYIVGVDEKKGAYIDVTKASVFIINTPIGIAGFCLSTSIYDTQDHVSFTMFVNGNDIWSFPNNVYFENKPNSTYFGCGMNIVNITTSSRGEYWEATITDVGYGVGGCDDLDALGSCCYQDSEDNFECDDYVSKDYCDALNGAFKALATCSESCGTTYSTFCCSAGKCVENIGEDECEYFGGKFYSVPETVRYGDQNILMKCSTFAVDGKNYAEPITSGRLCYNECPIIGGDTVVCCKNGICLGEVSRAVCELIHQGKGVTGVTCGSVDCCLELPFYGACCTKNSDGTTTCSLEFIYNCKIRDNKVFMGHGTNCENNICCEVASPPNGWCCINSGLENCECIQESEQQCLERGGSFNIDPEYNCNQCCPQIQYGNCCKGNGTSTCQCDSNIIRQDCISANGIWSQDENLCEECCDNTAPRGRCCNNVGGVCTCNETTEYVCELSGGIWHDNPSYDCNDCCENETYGYCCIDAGPDCNCSGNYTESQCDAVFGVWSTNPQLCSTSACCSTTLPDGYCCVRNGIFCDCNQTNEITCNILGGTFHPEEGYNCNDCCKNPENPYGYCCVGDGDPCICSYTTEGECIKESGIWHDEEGYNCEDCCPEEETYGHCCVNDPTDCSCTFVTQTDCSTLGGSWSDDPEYDCANCCQINEPYGYCCVGDGSPCDCSYTTEAECLGSQGVWHDEIGYDCTDCCPEEDTYGYCCVNDESGCNCSYVSQSTCGALGGSWNDDPNYDCSDCCVAPIFGNCCISTGTINCDCRENITQSQCETSLGGVWSETTPCFQCCGVCTKNCGQPNCSCNSTVTYPQCIAQGGTWNPPDYNCNDCCPPTQNGWCCDKSETPCSCYQSTSAACTGTNKTWNSNQSICTTCCEDTEIGKCCINPSQFNCQCVDKTRSECKGLGGVWNPLPYDCTECCPAVSYGYCCYGEGTATCNCSAGFPDTICASIGGEWSENESICDQCCGHCCNNSTSPCECTNLKTYDICGIDGGEWKSRTEFPEYTCKECCASEEEGYCCRNFGPNNCSCEESTAENCADGVWSTDPETCANCCVAEPPVSLDEGLCCGVDSCWTRITKVECLSRDSDAKFFPNLRFNQILDTPYQWMSDILEPNGNPETGGDCEFCDKQRKVYLLGGNTVLSLPELANFGVYLPCVPNRKRTDPDSLEVNKGSSIQQLTIVNLPGQRGTESSGFPVIPSCCGHYDEFTPPTPQTYTNGRCCVRNNPFYGETNECVCLNLTEEQCYSPSTSGEFFGGTSVWYPPEGDLTCPDDCCPSGGPVSIIQDEESFCFFDPFAMGHIYAFKALPGFDSFVNQLNPANITRDILRNFIYDKFLTDLDYVFGDLAAKVCSSNCGYHLLRGVQRSEADPISCNGPSCIGEDQTQPCFNIISHGGDLCLLMKSLKGQQSSPSLPEQPVTCRECDCGSGCPFGTCVAQQSPPASPPNPYFLPGNDNYCGVGQVGDPPLGGYHFIPNQTAVGIVFLSGKLALGTPTCNLTCAIDGLPLTINNTRCLIDPTTGNCTLFTCDYGGYICNEYTPCTGCEEPA